MNVLILGSGGREHAFALSVSKSNLLNKLYIAPGNAGTCMCGNNVNIQVNDFEAIAQFALKAQINMIIVGPEDPLVNGITDFFKTRHDLKDIIVIGPSKAGALLEGSKDFSKSFMKKYQIPTAQYQTFSKDNIQEAISFLKSLKPPYVLKADGLAAGKGVVINDDFDATVAELKEMIEHLKFGEASAKVVIEEYLSGIELSVFVLTNGTQYLILPEAKDYKRIGDNDTGLNTGGMGAVSPVPFADEDFIKLVEKQIVIPTIEGLKSENIPYLGFIFIGLMNVNGKPYVIEYNCRMGDPETEVVLPRINNDLIDILIKTHKLEMDKISLSVNPQTAATIMLVSGGYPEKYQKGYEIIGLENIEESIVFHAGTKPENEKTLTNGGRVLAITSLGKDIQEAFQKSYKTSTKIHFTDKYQRSDLGQDLLKYKK
ncbi:MAG: phosphoribosylamine--glycine ligase [Bacteroidia bacterium]|nr:phosphoribosylamine--glycine ligase [Bacteroidia bacterium]MCZ2247722.1 phosphoribosylamine--glycine ligase [Bacteroidia bacterium]